MTNQKFESFEILDDSKKKYYFNTENKKSYKNMKKTRLCLHLCKLMSLIICVTGLILTYYYRVDILKVLNFKQDCVCEIDGISNSTDNSIENIYKILDYDPEKEYQNDYETYKTEMPNFLDDSSYEDTVKDDKSKIVELETSLNFTLDTLKKYVFDNAFLKNRTSDLESIISSNAELIEYLNNKTSALQDLIKNKTDSLEQKESLCNKTLSGRCEQCFIELKETQSTNLILNNLNSKLIIDNQYNNKTLEKCFKDLSDTKETNSILNILNSELISKNISTS